MSKPTTTKYAYRQYRCVHCGTEHSVGSNHYGEVYSRCPNGSCVSRRPMINATYQPPRHVCIETLPEDMGVPEPWIQAKLGDVCEIKRGTAPPQAPYPNR